MDEKITDAEVKELNNIADVLQRVQQAMTKINELMGCQAPSKLASSALDAQFICYGVLRSEQPRSELGKVMNTLEIARNTIGPLNFALEQIIDSAFTQDIKTAWWNAYAIKTNSGEFKQYK